MEPQDRKLNVERKWYGPESVGRRVGEPAVFLYYGRKGVDSNYTVRSATREIEGYRWTSRISGHGSHIIFNYFDEEGKRDVDPLSKRYSEEIRDFLLVQKYNQVGIHTPAFKTPTEEVDGVVDFYVVRLSCEKFREKVDDWDEIIEWFSEESRKHDRVDFILGFDGLRKNKQYLQDFSKMYSIPDRRIYVYAEDDEDFVDLTNMTNATGNRVTLRPDYFRKKEDKLKEDG